MPIPWLHGVRLDSWLIVFRISRGRTLLVPCVEFFSRCYGHSKELQRVLLTYPWVEVERRLFHSHDPLPPSQNDVWEVRLGRKMTLDDAVFLAHIQHDKFTQGCVKRLYAEREVASGSPDPGVPLRVGPWFGGPSNLRVRGYWLDDSTFLAIRVDGSGEPAGGPDVCVDAPAQSSDEGEPEEASGPENGGGSFLPRMLGLLSIVPTHSGRDPDSAVGYGVARDPDFVILGPRRKVIHRTRARESERPRTGRGHTEEPKEYSTSEPRLTGESVGQAIYASKPALETHGILLDMWNALLFVRQEHPDAVHSVEWFTIAEGFGTRSPPRLIALPALPSNEDDSAQSAPTGWRRMDPSAAPEDARGRGVLVVRVRTREQTLCLVEIERRPRGEDAEETFSGLVFPIPGPGDLSTLLRPLLEHLSSESGIFSKALKLSPIEGAKTFAHHRAKSEKVACEAAVRNAFRKMGVNLLRPV